MRVKIIEIELDEPLPSLSAELVAGYTHLQVLVRRKKVPLGYLWLELKEPALLSSALKQEIEQHFTLGIQEAELKAKEAAANLTLPEKLPLVTVVVCTRNRPEALKCCLESLVALDYPCLELVIVDNAPADERSREVVAAYSQFRYVLEPRPGLDWARNRGIAEAQGEIIAYTDDDVRVDPLWVQNIVKAFTLSPSVMCVTGLVAPAERETAAQHLFENYGGFGRGFKRRIHSREEPKNSWYFPLNAGWFGTGCNMAYRRVFFDQHGPFDEAMDVGTLTHGGGDLEMFYRVLRANYTLVYEPEALVWHYHRREYAKLRQQLYDFGRGYYAFLTRCFMSDPPMRRTIVRWGLHWYRRWFLHRMRYRPKIGRKLVVLEAIGALQGPFYYFRARLQAKKITRLYGRVMKWPTNVKIK